MGLTAVVSYATRPEAEVARARLAAAGIAASVHSDDAGGMYPNLSTSGVRVMVQEQDLEYAEEVLAEGSEVAE
jgi:hypothetical protein